MKKTIALLAVFSMILSGCASQGGAASAHPSQSDREYVQEKGTLVVGMTEFAPMDYREEGSEEWIGFDADLAKAFAESLGVEAEFLEINWDMKALELENRGVDVVWNGMTLTQEVRELMSTSQPYCLNGQVVVVPQEKAADYTTAESLSGLQFAAENGSAGAAELDELGIEYIAMDTQAKALMEVAAGTSDACVIDLLMANAMIGPGTDYPQLTATVQLSEEEYGVGFRKGSDLTEAFNAFWKEAVADGTAMETAQRYGINPDSVVTEAAGK